MSVWDNTSTLKTRYRTRSAPPGSRTVLISPHRLEGWEPLLSTDCTNVVLATQTALRDAAQETQTPTGGDISTAAVNAENMNWLMARDEAIYSSIIENVEATQAGLEWARYLDEAHMPIPNNDDALTLGAAKQVLAAVELGHKIRALGIASHLTTFWSYTPLCSPEPNPVTSAARSELDLYGSDIPVPPSTTRYLFPLPPSTSKTSWLIWLIT